MVMDRTFEGIDKQLALSDTQIDAIDDLRKRYREEWSTPLGKTSDSEYYDRANEIYKTYNAELGEILLPFQVQAYRAVAVKQHVSADNRRGLDSFDSPAASGFASVLLDLSSDQTQKTRKLRDNASEELAELVKSTFEPVRSAEIEKTRKRIRVILEPAQREKLDEMLGDRFDFEKYPREFDIAKSIAAVSGKNENAVKHFFQQQAAADSNDETTPEPEPFDFFEVYTGELFPHPKIPTHTPIIPTQTLLSEAVLPELRISKEQGRLIEAIQKEMDQIPTQFARGDYYAGLAKAAQSRREVRGKFKEQLLPHQRHRIDELTAQWLMAIRGIEFAVQIMEIRKALQVSDEQLESIKAELNRINTVLSKTLLEIHAQRIKVAKRVDKEFYDLLSAEQKKIFNQYFGREEEN